MRRMYWTKLFSQRECLTAFPNLCCQQRWYGRNRINHPDWVKLCVDANGRIKLRAKQKYEIPSAIKLLYKKWSYIYVCKTRMLSVKLNVCILVSMSELKRKDRLVHTYMCMCVYACVLVYIRSTLLTVVYLNWPSGVNLSYRDVPVCWSRLDLGLK